ncbi:MAG TPA: tyrosine-type recombinase/integrase [Pirellulales bacterium]|nr:tyrosine-type recombinase/integrase [Pirellulales bacterium]
MQKLWYRRFDDSWYVTVREGGRQVQKKLVKGKGQKKEAERRFHRLMLEAGRLRLPSDASFAKLADLFLEVCEEEHPKSLEWYTHFLQSFVDSYKGTVRALKPGHVRAWLRKNAWSQSTQRQAIVAVKRVINWAFDEGHIRRKPLRKLKRPAMERREALISKADHQAILKSTDAAFADFATALSQTGARPGEIRTVSAEMVNLDLGVWVLPQHKTAAKTGRPRIIYLTPTMVTLTKKLMAKFPSGPLFRNRFEKPWSANAIRCRMRRLRKKLDLPKGTVAYSYRHSFATDSLERGIPVADVAQLLGHVDLKQLQTYGHLDQRTQHMRQAAAKAVR